MTLSTLLTFMAVAVVVVVVPGPDLAVVTKNTLAGGRARGWATSIGITASNVVQGAAAALGLGAVIVGSQPVFHAIRWAGVVYLACLAAQALRSAWRGRDAEHSSGRLARTGFREGFLSNVTNPKVLVFYLAVLPQFMSRGDAAWGSVLLALTHAVIALAYLAVIVMLLDKASAVLRRRGVRRALDAVTGVALGAFSLRLATDSSGG